MTGVEAQVARDGSVRLALRDAGERALLELPAPLPAVARAARPGPAFTGRYREGDTGGQRGFAPGADDDGDGRRDEDRADGRDNDGDGRADEDFAAISDAMAVVDHGADGPRLEAYRWAYPQLRATIFLNWQHPESRPAEDLVCELAAGTWHETELSWNAGPETPGGAWRRAALLAAPLPEALPGAPSGWLGLVRLTADEPGARRPMRIAGGRLVVPPESGRQAVAVSVAPSLLLLRARLTQALLVHRGAAAGPDGGRVAWIVPPARPPWLTGAQPVVACESDSSGRGWRLAIAVPPGADARFDPDGFVLDGRPLGSPVTLAWRPAAGDDAAWSVAWRQPRAESLASLPEEEQDPYLRRSGAAAPQAGGTLTLAFDAGAPAPTGAPGDRLVGSLLSGGSFSAQLSCPGAAAPAPEAALSPAGAAEAGERGERRRTLHDLPLSASLLDNYPNPFRASTRVRFRVPATVGEAFEGSPGADKLTLDPQTALPYRLSSPQVSLRVYSLIGQEIRTLHQGPLGPGPYEAAWDGTDESGRAVASGTYFCKLQVEGWSVTKRVVYLR